MALNWDVWRGIGVLSHVSTATGRSISIIILRMARFSVPIDVRVKLFGTMSRGFDPAKKNGSIVSR